MRLLLLASSLLLLAATSASAAPRVATTDAPQRVAQWARFEATAAVSPAPANPFDPAEVDLRAVFESPDGRRLEAIGFWYQGFERSLVNGRERLDPVGDPDWRVRFTPDRPGRWRWYWRLVTPEGVAETKPVHLVVTGSDRPGFLRASPRDARYLAFDDGTPYFAVGENTGWYDGRGSFAYDSWFGQLAGQGANYGRLWMPSWAFGIEWNDTGLGQYHERLGRAWQLDTVLETAEANGIYVMLSLLAHGSFSAFFNPAWDGNPYNEANGGPLATGPDFFADETARALFERRVRYIVARYGWSTHLLAWELWNEVDLVSVVYRSQEVTAWHRHFVEVLRALDPHQHLVTTSHSRRTLDPRVWSRTGIDFTQIHHYGNGLPPEPNLAAVVLEATAERIEQTERPVLVGEIGVDTRGPGETRQLDPEGIGIHDGLWAGVVSGGLGTAMSWWWDNLIDLEPERYYPMFGAVARFVAGVAFDREGFAAFATSLEGTARPVVAHGLAGERTWLVWLKDDAFQWYAPDSAAIANARLTLEGLAGGWCARFYDTWEGAWSEPIPVHGMDGHATLDVPVFHGDLALRLQRGCAVPGGR